MNKRTIYIAAVAGSILITSCGRSAEEGENKSAGNDSVTTEKQVDTSSAAKNNNELYSDDFIEEASVIHYHTTDKKKSVFWAYNMETDVAYLYQGENTEAKERIVIHKEEPEANSNNRILFAHLQGNDEEEFTLYLDYGDPSSTMMYPVRIILNSAQGEKTEFLPQEGE